MSQLQWRVGVVGSGPTAELEWENETMSADRQDRAESRQRQGRKWKGMGDSGRGVQKGAGRMVMYS